MKLSRFQLGATTALLALIMVLGAFSFRLWSINRELLKKPDLPPVIYRQALIQNSFLNSDGLASYSNQNVFSDEKKDLIEEKKNFVEADLQKMILTLYENGEAKEEFPVLSKGREGSWWETPTGKYKALTKEVNHFSSIGKVWMPWSIQFYGNFFIHGWPYHQNGEPVPKSYSGGCVRLSSEDAEKVFSFVTEGMPIILLDAESDPVFRFEIQPSSSEIGVPAILAKAALVSDLDTGGIILDKNANDVLPIASLTKLMTATVASELIYLGRSVVIDEAMLRDKIQSYPLKAGERVQAFDLLYPLLMESSNGASRALAAFLGERYFLSQMKVKAMTLSMKDTNFQDPAGIDGGNVSTLKDLARLSKYILEKRRFIFEIGKGEDFRFFGVNTLSGIKNYNEFAEEKNLVGMKNGETEAAGQTILTVWKMKDKRGDSRNIFIGILGSGDRVRDVEAARVWLKAVFGLE